MSSEIADQQSEGSEAHSLRRDLGLRIAIAVVVGNVIGSGIFLKPGNIAAESGRFDVIIAVWIFGGSLCLLGGLCFAELATMLPQAGGLYVYLREAYGKLPAFLFGWTEVFFGKPASIGALAVPSDVRFTDALPKTRSGKIMRRLLRDIAAGKESVGDTTTLEDYSVLAKLRGDED